MRRISIEARKHWQQLVSERGLLHHTHDDGAPYWLDGVYYSLEAREVEALEQATEELMEMCIAAVDHVIARKRFDELGIPRELVPMIESSWERETPALYDRFDLALTREGNLKLLELNGSTPTALLEAAITQHDWRLTQRPEADQFNWIWEALVAKWTELRKGGHLPSNTIHTVCAPFPEDGMTATLIADAAQSAGLTVHDIHPDHIDWDKDSSFFRDTSRDGCPRIDTLFSLIPLEWLVDQTFRDGTRTIDVLSTAFRSGSLLWMDPPWNAVFANKGILAVLWELYPGHPLLVPAYLDGPRDMTNYVIKPCQSREGANVSIVREGKTSDRSGGDWETSARKLVYQGFIDIAPRDGNFPIIGSWYVPDQGACGIGIRESSTIITGSDGRFAPHIIE